MLKRVGAGHLDIICVEHVLDRDRAGCDGVFKNPGQRNAGFHGAGDEFGVLLADRPQLVFDLFLQWSIRCLEQRPRAGLCVVGDAQAAGADILQGGVEALVCRQLLGIASDDQNICHGNFVDRRRDGPARSLDFDFEVARQPFVLATVLAVSLTQQHGAA